MFSAGRAVVVVMRVLAGADTSKVLALVEAPKASAPRVSVVRVVSPATTESTPPPVPAVKAPKVCEAAKPARPTMVKRPPDWSVTGLDAISEALVPLLTKSRRNSPPWTFVAPV